MSRPAARKAAPKGEYIETDSGNKVSRRSAITGTANITLGGRTVIMSDVHLRGDLHATRPVPSSSSSSSLNPSSAANPPAKEKSAAQTAISIGRCTIVSTGSVLKPPSRISRGVVTYYPMKIGDHVFIGPSCTISAISISNHVHIGANVSIGSFVLVKEGSKILPGTIVPNNMVIPSGSIVGGRPARIVGMVGEGWGVSAGLGVGGGEGGDKWVEGGDLRELVRSIK